MVNFIHPHSIRVLLADARGTRGAPTSAPFSCALRQLQNCGGTFWTRSDIVRNGGGTFRGRCGSFPTASDSVGAALTLPRGAAEPSGRPPTVSEQLRRAPWALQQRQNRSESFRRSSRTAPGGLEAAQM